MSASVIYGILKTNAAVTALVGTRIYKAQAKQFDSVPFIVYFKISTNPAQAKSGPSKLDTLRVQVSLYHSDGTAIDVLAETVRTALDRYSGTVGAYNVDSISFLDDADNRDPDTKYYHIAQDYQIRIKR